MSTSEEEKKLGNEAFTSKNYDLAVEHFTRAIEMDPSNPVLYSNRSAAYAGLRKYNEALQDADTVIRLDATWVRGHGRRATALHFLGRLEEAKEEYEKVLSFEPSNANAQSGLNEINASLLKQQMEGVDSSTVSKMFLGDVFSMLAADPLTAEFYKDKEFVENINKIRSNPEALFKLCNDNKVFAATRVLVEHTMKERTRAMQHEKEMDEGAKAAAEQEKELGNRDYKAKKFETALKHYQTAMELYPREVTYKSNMSAAYFEMNDFDKCIDTCLECLDDAQRLGQETLLPKLLTRIGFAYYKKQDYDKAIEYYQRSIKMKDSDDTRSKLLKAEQAKKSAEKKEDKLADTEAKSATDRQEAQESAENGSTGANTSTTSATATSAAVFAPQISGGKTQAEFSAGAPIDPAKKEEDRRNTLYRNGQYLSALEAYTGAIEKDPKNASLYVSRAAVHVKLCDYVHALEDTEVAISLDPKLIKAYVKKAACHYYMKEYRKAVSTLEQGLHMEPENQDCINGIAEIEQLMSSRRQEDRHANRHSDAIKQAVTMPDVRCILADPAMRKVLQDITVDPQSAFLIYKNDMNVLKNLKTLSTAGIFYSPLFKDLLKSVSP